MGGTKKKATVPTKKESKYKIPSLFDCPLCDAKKSIAIKLIRSNGVATVHCRVCQAGDGKQYPFVPLERPVDVFFRFREEVMEQDQELLRTHNIEVGAMPACVGLSKLARNTAPRTTDDIAWASVEAGDYDNLLSTVKGINSSAYMGSDLFDEGGYGGQLL